MAIWITQGMSDANRLVLQGFAPPDFLSSLVPAQASVRDDATAAGSIDDQATASGQDDGATQRGDEG